MATSTYVLLAIVVIALAITATLPEDFTDTSGEYGNFNSDIACPKKSKHVPTSPVVSDDDVPFFSRDYFEARGKFRRLVHQLQEDDESIELVEMVVFVDEVSERKYTQDVAIIPGGTNGRLFMHLSATHGSEGFAGSAIQLRVLSEWERIQASVPEEERPTLLMVHAMNPYGFANNRRWNENNVDINRNLLLTESEWARVQKRDPNHSGYMDWDFVFNPLNALSLFERVAFFPKALYYLALHGKVKLMKAVVGGTYHNNKGIFYGGDKLQQSHVNLLNLLRTHQQKSASEGDNAADAATFIESTRTLALIDVHSGLGPPGIDTILCTGNTVCSQFSKKILPNHIVGEEKEDSGDGSGTGSSAYIAATGFTTLYENAFTNLNLNRSYVVTEEFGTVPVTAVIRALVMENAAYHYARDTHHHLAAGRDVRNAFYLAWSDKWMCDVLTRGLDIFERVYAGFDDLEAFSA
eukprot:TRINITY_DN264_c6_g1_i1.p1 TRINITY_DN264_c6_g1~~TRINITY_DN264_c6_g1_i1.p1  ORF type:complete len:477 (+),score=100.98 TRINITY_DN264_c6_g1_i1:36-1433(+)